MVKVNTLSIKKGVGRSVLSYYDNSAVSGHIHKNPKTKGGKTEICSGR